MKLYTIETGFFKLDGGSMFGVVPKVIWNKLNPADENNLCNWALRCLLIEINNRLILIDNGVGNKQDENFFKHYHLFNPTTLEKSIKDAGFSFADITDVLLTHLHFDHCGGSVKKKDNGNGFEPTFPNATYWVNESHWNWAVNPNAREKPSFLKENLFPMEDAGQLKKIQPNFKLLPEIDFIKSDGHTEGMLLPRIKYNGKTIVFMADLIPSTGHIQVPYVMGYDVRPLITMKEKEEFYKIALKEDYILFFEHDPKVECCTLQFTEKGVRKKEEFRINEI